MKINKFSNYFRWQTGVLTVFCAMLIYVISLYHDFPNYIHTHNVVCRANIQIMRDGVEFKGIVDIKSDAMKGIANINGFISQGGQSYIVDRTVLFTHKDYGVSPIWSSHSIIPSNRETVSASLLDEVLPKFYLQKHSVTEVDVFPINNTAFLITKEGIPYFYCQKYTLPDEE